MKEHLKKIITDIKEHRRSNPSVHTYTMALPTLLNAKDSSGKVWPEKEMKRIKEEIESLKQNIVSTFKDHLDCYVEDGADGSSILIIHFPLHNIEFKSSDED